MGALARARVRRRGGRTAVALLAAATGLAFFAAFAVVPAQAQQSSSTTTSVPSGGGGDSAAPPVSPKTIPSEVQRLINSVRRSAPNNTQKLVQALQPLGAYGLSPRDAAVVGMGRFPVAGYATFTDDWWFPRFTPYFHLHEGTDIFAAANTPVRAPVDGTLRLSTEGIGGLSAYVKQPDGTYFYMAHLAAFVQGQATGQSVRTGQVVGFVGTSGNARGGPAHVHFEIHPKGGGPIDPKPYLDRWIAEATANAPRLLTAFQRSRPRPSVAAGATRLIPDGDVAPFAAPPRPSSTALAWLAAAGGAGGSLRLTENAIGQMADEADWTTLAQHALERSLLWQQARVQADILIAPITPRPLRSALGLPL